MMYCNSQAHIPGREQVVKAQSTILSPRMSPTAFDDEHPKPLTIVPAPIAIVELVPPTSWQHSVASIILIPDSPPSTMPSCPVVRNAAVQGSDTPATPFTQPLPETNELECVQPSPAVVEEDVQTQEITRAVQDDMQTEETPRAVEENVQTQEIPQVVEKGAQTVLRAEVSSSAVNVIPLDHHNPEATLNAPQAVKRYLTRWPRGDNLEPDNPQPHPVFDNTQLHDYRTMHNNQDDEKRRAALAQVVPSHVKVSLLHP